MAGQRPTNDLIRAAIGEHGGAYVADTAAHAGDWFAIQVVTAATFDVLTGNLTGATGVAFPAGTILFGVFTTFTLSSGAVIAYRWKPANS